MAAITHHMIPGAPTPVAPFSHAVEVDGWAFITGQMPIAPGNEAAPLAPDIETQTRVVFANLQTVLRGLGLDLEHVVAGPLARASA
jgi:enamine deaminase RidA (YjgF/YER057c/UK114 family)